MKAILILDEMPSCCLACPVHDRSDYADGCLAVNRRHSNGQYLEKREEWCPLRLIPTDACKTLIKGLDAWEGMRSVEVSYVRRTE